MKIMKMVKALAVLVVATSCLADTVEVKQQQQAEPTTKVPAQPKRVVAAPAPRNNAAGPIIGVKPTPPASPNQGSSGPTDTTPGSWYLNH